MGQNRGEVCFEREDEMKRALKDFDGYELNGREITVKRPVSPPLSPDTVYHSLFRKIIRTVDHVPARVAEVAHADDAAPIRTQNGNAPRVRNGP